VEVGTAALIRTRLLALGCALVALAAPASASATLTATIFATDTGPGKVVVADDDGTGMRVLSNNKGSSYVSPDGAHVAVNAFDQKSASDEATNFRLELFAAAGGLSRVVGTLCRPLVWSPDSSTIACVDWNEARGPSHLLLIDPAAGSTTTLVTGFLDSQVSFSPDSKRLAYVQGSTEDWSTTGG
jgi:Tol biopolymer transport system component